MGNGGNLEYISIPKDQYLEYEQLNTFFMLSGDLLCIAGFDGYFKKINPAVSKLLGYTEHELMSSPINEFVFSEDRELTSNSRDNIHRGKPLLHFENRYLTKTGEIIWLSWTSMPYPDKKVVFAIAKNITEKKRLEEERNAFIENLSRVNKDLQQFTRMTSHDIRSPLNNLQTIFSLLDISKIDDPETVVLVNLLKTSSEQLNETVNNYVDVLIRNDKLNVSIEKVDLTVILNLVRGTISSLIKDSGAIIPYDFSECNCISFNKIYLESVFLNLITNAIKYAHPDKLPRINMQTRVLNAVNQLIISDNGLGFDMEKVEGRIFGLYEVFHDRPDSKGIGLHLVYNHITSLGGHISVESKINEGTTFTISFKE